MTKVARHTRRGNAHEPSVTTPRDETAHRLRREIVVGSRRAQKLVGRVETFEVGMSDAVTMARAQLDELAASIEYMRANLSPETASDVIAVAARAKRIFMDRESDSPTAVAAWLMTCVDHVMSNAVAAKLGEPVDDGALLEAAQSMGSLARIVRLEFAEHFPEHARRLTLESIDQLIEASIPERGSGSKWSALADVCKRELKITVDGERVKETRKPSRAGGA